MKIKAKKKTILQALLLTSLFWISLDVLFFLHKQSPNIDLDVVVISGHNNMDVIRSTTPSKPNHRRFAYPTHQQLGAVLKESSNHEQYDPISDQVDTELFPDLVIRGLGQGGLKAELPDELRNLSKSLFSNHSFDSVLSDRMSMNRKLPDARGKE